MSFQLYRRHAGNCAVHKLKRYKGRERDYRDCDCPIWVHGKEGILCLDRQATGTRVWHEAEDWLKRKIAGETDRQIHGPTIADLIAKYLEQRKADTVENTHTQITRYLGDWQKWLTAQGVVHADELDKVDLDDWSLTLKGRSATKAQRVNKVKTFLRAGFRRDWFKVHPDKMSPVRVIDEDSHEPYTEEDIAKIFATNGRRAKQRGGFQASPETFMLLCRLMLETGLRISDAVRFDPKRATQGVTGKYIYRYQPKKQKKASMKKWHEVYLKPELYRAIADADWFSKELPFCYPTADPEQRARETLIAIGEAANVERCTPHRFRDTFAVRHLEKGTGIGDVQRLLGHASVKTTERHYAKWTTGRETRLEALA